MAHCKQTVKGEYKNHILEKWIMWHRLVFYRNCVCLPYTHE
jgi:hypothetical protein